MFLHNSNSQNGIDAKMTLFKPRGLHVSHHFCEFQSTLKTTKTVLFFKGLIKNIVHVERRCYESVCCQLYSAAFCCHGISKSLITWLII